MRSVDAQACTPACALWLRMHAFLCLHVPSVVQIVHCGRERMHAGLWLWLRNQVRVTDPCSSNDSNLLIRNQQGARLLHKPGAGLSSDPVCWQGRPQQTQNLQA